MAKADSSKFSSRERLLLRRHRQSVAKFERIYGPVGDVLGWSTPWRQQADAAINPTNTQKSDRSIATSTCSLPKGKEGGIPGTNALMSSERAAEVKGLPPKNPSKVETTPSKVKRTGKLPARSPTDLRKNVSKGKGSGSDRPSKPVVSKSPSTKMRSGPSPAGAPKGPRKETIKRARSGDDQPSSSSKKVKKSTSLDVCLQVAVIDRNDPDGRISTDFRQSIEGRLIDEIAIFEGESEDVSFNGADWVKGVKVVNCGNKNSLEFLKSAIGKCSDINPAAKLEVIQASELPLRSIVTVWIPPPERTVQTILAVLAKQNSRLLTDQWRHVSSLVCKENTGKDFRFAVDRKSLEVLDDMGGLLNLVLALSGSGTRNMTEPKKLLVVQINLHHCEAASAELVTFFIDSQTDVALIQEPWINNNKVLGLMVKGYTLFVPSSEDKVRTCILAKNELGFLISHSFRSGNITVINREAKGRRMLTLASVYMPYEATDPPGSEVRELTAYAKRKSAILVMGCDANAHHCQWGSKDINKRDELIFDFITDNNLIICNKGDTPTFRNKDREAVIDLTLINRLEDLVMDWTNQKVATDCSFSDHSRKSFTLDFVLARSPPFRDPRKTNWGTFNDRVESVLAQRALCDLLPTDLEGVVNEFTDLLKGSYELSCPVTFPGKRGQPKWWTKELRLQRSTVRKLFNRAKLTGRAIDWNNYKMCFNKYKADLKRAKRISWSQYCESIDNVNELSRFRRILSKDPKVIGYIQRSDNSWTESSSEKHISGLSCN
ncbi:Retrovirus-related Pol polyprotein from type-1 retrotransposable element R1 [Lucilia cuprina]|nr:Retrovirus-related Pol polyprotein from type-1 retrotransposable element R1 [Lucilia cuprina]